MKEIFRIFIVSALVLYASALPWAPEAYSQDTKAQEEHIARLQKEIAILDSQIKANSAQSSGALNNLTLIRSKVASRKQLVAESEKQIEAYSSTIETKEKEVDALEARLDTLSGYYVRLVRSAYKNRNAKVWYMYILASDNVGQAFRRYGYLRDLSKQMNIQASKIKETQASLEEEKTELAKMKSNAENIRGQRVSEVNKLQGEEKEANTLVGQLNRDKKKYQQELSAKKREVEALNREIERIIREAMEEKNASASSSSAKPEKGSAATPAKPRKPIDYTLAKQFEANRGKLPWPAEGPVVDHFGQHYHPVYTKVKLPFNNGITIAVSAGTPVKAVFNGEVKQIVVMPGYSKCVLVQHGNFFTFYCKLGSVNVKAGDKVKTGEVIGTVDTINGENQLHFQIWSGRNPQDPETWLRP